MLKLILVGVFVHLFLLYGAFDIYFTSPLNHGMTPHKAGGPSPAKRLVLFVADGLRANSLYGDHMIKRAPYLWSVKESIGSWGIAHTRVPTESRPGHIAILAGFGEDPSAITKGWKYNPVDFDSVINQSTNAWCWGSPDIVDIFNKDNLSRIHLHSYDAHMQDFSGKESTVILDTWVFDHVLEYLSTQNKDDCSDFCADGNIFFLHLLGLDTAGHSVKPHSKQYLENLKVVDNGIEEIVNRFENFFRDSQTAYIFTSDHGMTDWGSHGDGSEHETQVPFIAWGSGIVKNIHRRDLSQIDICPLISSLIGINIPINSLGVTPINYLNTFAKQKVLIFRANVLQLFEQFNAKQFETKKSRFLSLTAFYEFTEDIARDKLQSLHQFIINNNYEEAINLSSDFIKLCKRGIHYYERYYQNLLLFLLSLGFFGWIMFIFVSIQDVETNSYNIAKHAALNKFGHLRGDIFSKISSILMILCGLVIFVGVALPLNYFFYGLFPIIMWMLVIKYYKQATILSYFMYKNTSDSVLICCGYFIGVELLTLSFFSRQYLTLILLYFLCRTLFWENRSNETNLIWFFGHLLLSLCPILIEIQTDFYWFNHGLTLLCWILYGYSVFDIYLREGHVLIFYIQWFMLVLSFINSFMVHITITHGYGLLFINQVISWTLLVSSCVPIFFLNANGECKIIGIAISLITPYSLMAVGFESIFLVLFVYHILNWVSIENGLKRNSVTPLVTKRTDKQSIRCCFYCLTFIMMSYFGMGNTASMNSFDPMWVRCFVTVFSPYTMTCLIFAKLIIPFLMVMCAYSRIVMYTNARVKNSFLIILVFCDLMVIQFLYLIKNEGSWLEIGVSLSRFIVAMVTTIVLLLLYQIANCFLKCTLI